MSKQDQIDSWSILHVSPNTTSRNV